MIKRLARNAIAALSRASGAVARAEEALRDRLVILCYHRVLPASRKRGYFLPDLVVTPEAFRRHCLHLRAGHEVLPLGEAFARLRSGASRVRPLAAITFDDGYRDNHTYAAPILDQCGLRATFFVVADLVGAEQPPWYDRLGLAATRLRERRAALPVLAELGLNGASPRQFVAAAKALSPAKRRELVDRVAPAGAADVVDPQDVIMGPAELRDLVARGHEIGSHSATHEMLPQLDDETLAYEVARSRATLAARLDAEVRTFCYPNGDHDDRVVAAVTAAGYACAVTVDSGSNGAEQDPYRLRRHFIHEGRLAGLTGRPSATLLRLELSGLARKFRRD